MSISSFIQSTFSLFYPKVCLACGSDLSKQEQVICVICELRLPYTNFHHHDSNPLAKKFWGRIPLHDIDSLLYLEKASKTEELLYNLKYNNRQDIGTKLAEILVAKYDEQNLRKKYDGILSIPLHIKKLKLRTYNQCDSFAAHLSHTWQIPYFKKALERKVYNESQTGKNRINRWENVKGVFSVQQSDVLKDKHLLLIDDVLTTGATLEACAQKILEIENTKLSILTMACKI